MRVTASVLLVLLMACANRPGTSEAGAGSEGGAGPSSASEEPPASGDPSDSSDPGPADEGPSDESGDADTVAADVMGVEVSGSPGAYTFAVTLRSPDTGCDRYADWWEVVDAEGALLYRRILGHSHVDEQPFTRSGGPVPAAAEASLWIRAHMQGDGTSPEGYGGQVMMGSPQEGFSVADARELAPLHEADPLPDGCAF